MKQHFWGMKQWKTRPLLIGEATDFVKRSSILHNASEANVEVTEHRVQRNGERVNEDAETRWFARGFSAHCSHRL